MSRFMLKAALGLGVTALLAVGARADYRWYGSYDSQALADAAGQAEIDNHGADSYGAGFQPDDPTGGGGGPGYYVLVHYPDAPAPGTPPAPGGILGVPFPGDPDPADPDPNDPGQGLLGLPLPGTDDGMGP